MIFLLRISPPQIIPPIPDIFVTVQYHRLRVPRQIGLYTRKHVRRKKTFAATDHHEFIRLRRRFPHLIPRLILHSSGLQIDRFRRRPGLYGLHPLSVCGSSASQKPFIPLVLSFCQLPLHKALHIHHAAPSCNSWTVCPKIRTAAFPCPPPDPLPWRETASRCPSSLSECPFLRALNSPAFAHVPPAFAQALPAIC